MAWIFLGLGVAFGVLAFFVWFLREASFNHNQLLEANSQQWKKVNDIRDSLSGILNVPPYKIPRNVLYDKLNKLVKEGKLEMAERVCQRTDGKPCRGYRLVTKKAA